MRQFAILVACGLCLSGCSTFSFGPPDVSVTHNDVGRDHYVSCMPHPGGGAIGRNVDGALLLIDNFVDAYRCAAHSAADGRQAFEIPSFISLVGSAAAVALGAGRNVAIVGGIGNSVFSGGKAYYDPQAKVGILDHSLDALLCIQTEAVDIKAFDVPQVAQAEKTRFAAAMGEAGGDASEVVVTSDQQYFNMVAAALFSVERITALQLSRAGKFDPAGVVAEIEKLAKDEQAKKDAQKNPPPVNSSKPGGVPAFAAAGVSTQLAVQQVHLELDLLQTKLQQCVVRAKMG
jgi:hypothetical protein